jgi:hypothetical protein
MADELDAPPAVLIRPGVDGGPHALQPGVLPKRCVPSTEARLDHQLGAIARVASNHAAAAGAAVTGRRGGRRLRLTGGERA